MNILDGKELARHGLARIVAAARGLDGRCRRRTFAAASARRARRRGWDRFPETGMFVTRQPTALQVRAAQSRSRYPNSLPL